MGSRRRGAVRRAASPSARGRRPPLSLSRLPAGARRRVAQIRRAAAQTGLPAYLVGGAVRDLVLGRKVTDLDVAVEGDGIEFARALARRTGGTIREYGRFGTATVGFPGGDRVDVATSRSETYSVPGALPRVERASIGADLARRDFSINALALALGPGPPRLLDPFGGAKDLARRRVRILHPGSPLDDPTRAFRAVRYANRLGFAIEPGTRRAIGGALAAGAFARVSPDRLRREVSLLLAEPRPARAVAELARLGLAAVVHPNLTGGAEVRRRLLRAERLARSDPRVTWLGFLLVWAADLGRRELDELASRLNLARAARKMVRGWPERKQAIAGGDLDGRSQPLPDELIAAAAIAGARPQPPIGLSIRGSDLLAAGVPSGPAIGRALAATRRARSLGRISAREELAFALSAATGR